MSQTVERPWWRQRWLTIVAGYALAFLAGMAFAAWVVRAGGWHGGMEWETDVIHRVNVPLPAVIDTLMLVFPWFGTNISLIPGVLLVVIWLWWRKKRPHLAMRLLIVQIGSYSLNPALKYLFERPRPELVERRGWYGWASYPSGHAIASVAVLLTIALMLHKEKGWVWPYFVIVPIMLASLYSRIYLGVHWPTDVIGGALVGAVWLVMSTIAFGEGTRRSLRAEDLPQA
ncbi:MAG TPA: phosphatase PAP2 family protein [Gemmatimonadaceae bacterium]|nr:phosphatase PAP2 family protein [Gemmatimonadaceae bacterium]